MNASIFLKGSVGKNGKNIPSDVKWVQWFLNLIPPSAGGPRTALVLDGIAGPKTISAIQTFQFTQFYFHDGRVDPKGKTQNALFQSATKHNPQALHGKSLHLGVDASDWRYRSGSSISGSFTWATGVKGDFIADNDKNRYLPKEQWIMSKEVSYIGAGGTLGFLPIGFTASLSSLPGAGSRFFKGRNRLPWLGENPFFQGAVMFVFSAGLLTGNSVSIIFFGLNPGAQALVKTLVNLSVIGIPVIGPVATFANLLDELSRCSVYGAQTGGWLGFEGSVALYWLTSLSVKSVPCA
jgi:hypothetical protein